MLSKNFPCYFRNNGLMKNVANMHTSTKNVNINVKRKMAETLIKDEVVDVTITVNYMIGTYKFPPSSLL